MVYWLTNSITSSMRFYAEYFPIDPATAAPLSCPVAFAAFPQEILQVAGW